jgi:pSer/pThr/pTyr-binding forkhead associated (FHA) protein
MREFYLIPMPADTPRPDHPDTVIGIDHFPCIVGRHYACDRLLDHPKVSRRHCAFWLRDGRAWVKDLRSSNGTRLNGKPLTKARPLAEGDRLDIGGLPFLCLSRTSYEEAVGGAGEGFSVAGS